MPEDGQRDIEERLRRLALRQVGASPLVLARARAAWRSQRSERMPRTAWLAAAAAALIALDWWCAQATPVRTPIPSMPAPAPAPAAVPGFAKAPHRLNSAELADALARLHAQETPTS